MGILGSSSLKTGAADISLRYSLQTILVEAAFLETLDDIDDLLSKIWNIFHALNERKLVEIGKHNFQLELVKKVLSGSAFCKHLEKIQIKRENQKSKGQSTKLLVTDNEYLESGSFVKAALGLAFLPLTFFFNETNPKALRALIEENLRANLSIEDKFGAQRVAFIYHDLLLEKAFNHKIKFTKITQYKPFFAALIRASILAESAFVLSVQNELAAECFIRNTSTNDTIKNLQSMLKSIHDISHIIEIAWKRIRGTPYVAFFENFTIANETMLIKSMQIMSRGFFPGNFTSNLLKKITSSDEDLAALNLSAKSTLKAFSLQRDLESQWANKIYLNSVKVLAVFSALNGAENKRWIVNVAVREFHLWIQQAHEIINRLLLADDWQRIAPLLNSSIENKEIEWKSSFYIPINGETFSKDKKMVESIAETIIGMINSIGGTILVGFVEKPKKAGKKFQDLLKKRSVYYFFDLSLEFEALKILPDDIVRDLQQDIANLSGTPIGQFDDYWTLCPLSILCGDDKIKIFAIEVKKIDPPFISKIGNRIFIKRRISGRNAEVDPRDVYNFLQKK